MIANRMNAIAAPWPQFWLLKAVLKERYAGVSVVFAGPALGAGVDLVEHLPGADQARA